MEEKMTLREHFQIALRAVRWTFSIDRRYTLCLFACALFSAVAPFAAVYFSARVIDALAAGLIAQAALYAALAVGVTFLLRAAATAADSVKQTTSEVYFGESWKHAEKAMSMAYGSIESRDVALLRERISIETQTGYNRYFLFRSIESLTGNVTKIVSALALSASFFTLPSVPAGWKIALIVGTIVTAIAAVALGALEGRSRERFMKNCVHANLMGRKYGDYISEYASGQDIRLYGMEELVAGGLLAEDMAMDRLNAVFERQRALFGVPVTVLRHAMQFTAYAALILGALAGGVSVGGIAQYVACLMMMLSALESLSVSARRAMENDHYMKRYFSYFDIPNDMYQGTLTVEKRDDNDYNIEFRDVSFKYPGSDAYALRHVNLAFKVGEKLAVVGENGSGKTTFIKLLCRLYDPTEGEIRLNGVDIRKYDYDEYMSLFSVVFQDFKLFSFRLGQVVASNRTFDAARARDCLRKANFGDRLDALPEGLDSFLYKDCDRSGFEPSGGEGQKIALARALYKDAPFILLDEPTAALDPVSEYEVYSNFNAISGDRTAVYISHRLASCRFCDRIAVFDHGAIAQTGSHEALLGDEKGKYRALWTAQAQYYETRA